MPAQAQEIYEPSKQRDIEKTNIPTIRDSDRIRIAEAFKIEETFGNKIWKDWDKVPFALILVTPEYEFLIRHPNPSNDFQLLEYDSLLKCNVYYRKTVFQTSFLAAFPAVTGLSTIVVGQPENTNKSSSEWIITVLHEHFHQLQNFQPDYYSRVKALDLSGGDQTGMWMLNYPFPYDSLKIIKQISYLGKILNLAIKSGNKNHLQLNIRSYLNERTKFKNLLNEKDYKYFSFQVWQEGMARYTELKIAELLSKEYKPSKALSELNDFIPFEKIARNIRTGILNELNNINLQENKRVSFYSIGAAEGMLLDKVNPDWKDLYFKKMFNTEKYWDEKE